MPTTTKRKPRKTPTDTVYCLIGQPRALWDAVEAERGPMSRAEYVEAALRMLLPANVVATLPTRKSSGRPKRATKPAK